MAVDKYHIPLERVPGETYMADLLTLQETAEVFDYTVSSSVTTERGAQEQHGLYYTLFGKRTRAYFLGPVVRGALSSITEVRGDNRIIWGQDSYKLWDRILKVVVEARGSRPGQVKDWITWHEVSNLIGVTTKERVYQITGYRLEAPKVDYIKFAGISLFNRVQVEGIVKSRERANELRLLRKIDE